MADARHAAGATVLCVEDSRTNQDLMRSIFKTRPGVRLLIAGLGAEALELAVAERPALILLDLHLPDMTGEEILGLLRAREETESIPVVVVSGDAAESEPGGSTPDVLGYLMKPIDIQELLAYVDQAVASPG